MCNYINKVEVTDLICIYLIGIHFFFLIICLQLSILGRFSVKNNGGKSSDKVLDIWFEMKSWHLSVMYTFSWSSFNYPFITVRYFI